MAKNDESGIDIYEDKLESSELALADQSALEPNAIDPGATYLDEIVGLGQEAIATLDQINQAQIKRLNAKAESAAAELSQSLETNLEKVDSKATDAKQQIKEATETHKLALDDAGVTGIDELETTVADVRGMLKKQADEAIAALDKERIYQANRVTQAIKERSAAWKNRKAELMSQYMGE